MLKTTLGNTIGSILLGTIASSILFGVIGVQAFLYYTRYRQDWWFQKASVTGLVIFSTVHMALNIITVYHYLIENFGNVRAEQVVNWSFKLQMGFDILIVMAVQGLYVVRVWKLARRVHTVWPVIVAIVVAGGWAAGITLFIEVYRVSNFQDINNFRSTVNIALSFVVVTDAVVAVTICYYLQRSRTEFTSTNNALLKIMHYVLICGFLTTACSISSLMAFNAFSATLIFVGIDFLLPKLYINSYLALLNARKSTKEQESTATTSRVFHLQTRRTGHELETSNFGTDDEGAKNNDHISLSSERPKIDITVHHTVNQQHDQ